MLASVQNVENSALLTRLSPSPQGALFPRLRSQSFELHNVPTTYASSFEFSLAMPDVHCEHPGNPTRIVSNSSLGTVASLMHL
jgi:hypothetical protein